MFLVFFDSNDSEVRVNIDMIRSYQSTPVGGTKLRFSSDAHEDIYVKNPIEWVDTVLRELYITVHKRSDPQ